TWPPSASTAYWPSTASRSRPVCPLARALRGDCSTFGAPGLLVLLSGQGRGGLAAGGSCCGVDQVNGLVDDSPAVGLDLRSGQFRGVVRIGQGGDVQVPAWQFLLARCQP